MLATDNYVGAFALYIKSYRQTCNWLTVVVLHSRDANYVIGKVVVEFFVIWLCESHGSLFTVISFNGPVLRRPA